MPQVSLIPSRGLVVLHSFVDGDRIIRPCPRRHTEADVLAHALWLDRHKSHEAADEYLEVYLQGKFVTSH